MADDLPWWMRSNDPEEAAGDAGTPPTRPDTRDTPATPAADVLPGDRVICGRCSLPARWLPGGAVERADEAVPVTGECIRSGQGHGPWLTAPTTQPGGDFLDAMRASGGAPRGSW